MNLTETEIETDRVMIEKLRVYQQQLIDFPSLAHEATFESFMDITLNAMVVRLKSYVMAEQVDCRSKVVELKTTFPVYRTWWQHFKGEVFPEWLKRRFPPQFNYVVKTDRKKITFKKLATYPKANRLFPNDFGNVMVYRNKFEEEQL